MIYKNIHNVDLKKITYLKCAKDIWDILQLLYGGNNSRNKGEKENKSKNKKKKNDLQKQESWLEKPHPPSGNGSANHVKK